MPSGLIGDVTLNKESGGQSETLVSTPAFTQAPDVCASPPVFLSLSGEI